MFREEYKSIVMKKYVHGTEDAISGYRCDSLLEQIDRRLGTKKTHRYSDNPVFGSNDQTYTVVRQTKCSPLNLVKPQWL